MANSTGRPYSRWLSGIDVVVLSCLFIIVLIQIWDFKLSPREVGQGVTVELAGTTSTARMYGVEVRAVNNFFAYKTMEDVRQEVVDTCGSNFWGLLDSPDEEGRILANNFLALNVSGYGTRCIEEGWHMDFDGVRVKVNDIGKDVGDGTVQEIVISRQNTWIDTALNISTLILTLLVGSFLGLSIERRLNPNHRGRR